MSKIYEALEEADQIHHETKLPYALPPRSPWKRRLDIARRKEAEKRMIGYCVERIRAAVQHLVRDPEHARRLGQKAKTCYEQDHTVMRYAQRLAAVLKGE